jgi:hypothetical protein
MTAVRMCFAQTSVGKRTSTHAPWEPSRGGRNCCKSLRARWVQLVPSRAGALRKSTWGSAQTTAHSTRGFPSRATMLLNGALSLRRLSRRFSTPQFFDFCNRIGPIRKTCPAPGGSGPWGQADARDAHEMVQVTHIAAVESGRSARSRDDYARDAFLRAAQRPISGRPPFDHTGNRCSFTRGLPNGRAEIRVGRPALRGNFAGTG